MEWTQAVVVLVLVNLGSILVSGLSTFRHFKWVTDS